MKVTKLIWKSKNFGKNECCIAVQVQDGSYGVWSAKFTRDGRATGAAYAIGSGRGMTEEEAVKGAKQSNFRMGGPSVTGDYCA